MIWVRSRYMGTTHSRLVLSDCTCDWTTTRSRGDRRDIWTCGCLNVTALSLYVDPNKLINYFAASDKALVNQNKLSLRPSTPVNDSELNSRSRHGGLLSDATRNKNLSNKYNTLFYVQHIIFF